MSKETKNTKKTTLNSRGNFGHLEGPSPDGAFEVGSIAMPQVQELAPIPRPVNGGSVSRRPPEDRVEKRTQEHGTRSITPRTRQSRPGESAAWEVENRTNRYPVRSAYPPANFPQTRRFPLTLA